MPSTAYSALARSRIVRDYERAFRRATGIGLRLVPPDAAGGLLSAVAKGKACRALPAKTAQGDPQRGRREAEMRRRAGEGSSPRLLRCCAGVFLVAVPVEVDGRHAATLLAGPVRWRKPARRDWSRAARVLAEWGLNRPTSRARRACLRAPVVGGARYNGVVSLLRIFAQQLSQYAGCCRSTDPQVPPSVAKAMEFVQQRATKPVTMREAAGHVHLSSHYFCRLFKKTTGMTFSECVARTRVEKAKILLRNPFMRISEAAFESGFGSIPHFNSLFRRYTGKSPTDFRRSLRKGAASIRKARTEVGQSPV